MSETLCKKFTCNRCGTIVLLDVKEPAPEGWTKSFSLDFCPDCTEVLAMMWEVFMEMNALR